MGADEVVHSLLRIVVVAATLNAHEHTPSLCGEAFKASAELADVRLLLGFLFGGFLIWHDHHPNTHSHGSLNPFGAR